MFRFTIRDALWLTVVMAMAGALLYPRTPRVNDLPVQTRRASPQEIEAVNARYKAAKGEFEWQAAQYGYSDGFDAADRLAHAVEAMPDLELRVRESAKALEFAQSIVSIVQDKYEHGAEHAFMLYRAQYTRADLEARLRRAEQKLAAARANK
jgi:hypothetical protein